MKITKVNIPQSQPAQDGLLDIKMQKLGQVVLLAGKNGAGKTRVLDKILGALSSKPKLGEIESLRRTIKAFEKNILSNEGYLRESEFQISNPDSRRGLSLEDLKSNVESYKSNIKEVKKEINKLENQLNWNLVQTSEQSDHYTAIPFVPKQLTISDPNQYNKVQILSQAQNVNNIGVKNLHTGAFAKIQVIQDRWHNATHQSSKFKPNEIQDAIDDYNRLDNLIKTFLDAHLDRSIDGEATLFGFPLGKSNLSNGQRILLQFCIAIYSQEVELKDLILVLDEPENHLHPSIIIDIIDKLTTCVPNGQIWISTHSIPLLAHFDPSQIWYVENGEVSHAGKIPEKVLLSLLGNEDEIAKLQDFISLPSQFASSRYAFESLLEPGVSLTESNDPQSMQVRSDLLKLTSNESLRVLDFGAGKGRLISNISDLDGKDQGKLGHQLDYIAYDKYLTDKEQCEIALTKAYGSSENRYFNDFNVLYSKYDKKSFDVVIMCNVLHEIDPKDWLKLFQENGTISSLLKDTGILLLVEDHQIPIGEKAYQKGFLVLDTPQLKDLFKITEKDTDFIYSDQKGDGRLKAHQIPRRLLIQITEDSRLNAIKSVSQTARENILDIREKVKSYQNGKLHGFWTQQFANAQLNLAEFTSK